MYCFLYFLHYSTKSAYTIHTRHVTCVNYCFKTALIHLLLGVPPTRVTTPPTDATDPTPEAGSIN